MPRASEFAEPAKDRRAFEAELGDGIDGNPGPRAPRPPGRKVLEGMVVIEERMSLGMTGDAHGLDAVRLDQAGSGGIETRFERPPRGGDIAGDQEDAPHIGLAAGPREEIAERLVGMQFRARQCAAPD